MSSEQFHIGPTSDPDRYLITEPVGAGAEGVLYRGSLTIDGVALEVAVKMLHPSHHRQISEWSRRWNEQVELLRSLQAPGVVPVRDGFIGPPPHALGTGETSDSTALYLVMNWIEGTPLDVWAQRHQEALPEDRLKLLLPVAGALDLMHSGSATGGVPVIHGDVKPSNILVRDSGDSVLVDFGLVRLLPGGEVLTGISGTPGFLAPEIRAAGHYSAASDRYALGAVAYFLLTGLALSPDAADEMLESSLRSSQGMNPEIASHVMAMLSKDPSSRPSVLANWCAQLRNSSLELHHQLSPIPDIASSRSPQSKESEVSDETRRPVDNTGDLDQTRSVPAIRSSQIPEWNESEPSDDTRQRVYNFDDLDQTRSVPAIERSPLAKSNEATESSEASSLIPILQLTDRSIQNSQAESSPVVQIEEVWTSNNTEKTNSPSFGRAHRNRYVVVVAIAAALVGVSIGTVVLTTAPKGKSDSKSLHTSEELHALLQNFSRSNALVNRTLNTELLGKTETGTAAQIDENVVQDDREAGFHNSTGSAQYSPYSYHFVSGSFFLQNPSSNRALILADFQVANSGNACKDQATLLLFERTSSRSPWRVGLEPYVSPSFSPNLLTNTKGTDLAEKVVSNLRVPPAQIPPDLTHQLEKYATSGVLRDFSSSTLASSSACGSLPDFHHQFETALGSNQNPAVSVTAPSPSDLVSFPVARGRVLSLFSLELSITVSAPPNSHLHNANEPGKPSTYEIPAGNFSSITTHCIVELAVRIDSKQASAHQPYTVVGAVAGYLPSHTTSTG